MSLLRARIGNLCARVGSLCARVGNLCARIGNLCARVNPYSTPNLQTGPYYLKLDAMRDNTKNKFGHKRTWGFLPRLALTAMGTNNAQSFNERHNSAGKAFVTDKRRNVDPVEVEMVATLRINRPVLFSFFLSSLVFSLSL